MAFKAMGGMRSLVKMGTQKGRWRPRTWRPEATTDMWKRGAARKPGGKLQDPADAGEDDVPLMSGQPGAEVLRSQVRWGQGMTIGNYIW